MSRRVVVVSESAKVRETLAAAVRRRGGTPTLAASGEEAARVLATVAADAALVEVRRLDHRSRRLQAKLEGMRPGCRVVLLTSFGAVRHSPDLLQFGAEDYLLAAEDVLALLEERPGGLAGAGAADGEKGVQALLQTVDVLVGLLELGDAHFQGSSHRAARLVRSVAEEMGLDKEHVEEVVLANLLKDIGKTGLDAAVLSDEAAFDESRMAIMREHVPGSVRLLEHIDYPWGVLPVIRHHHERYDGKGYPDGLKGREIPLGGRIVAVVDAFVAMCSSRPHRPPLDTEDAVAELERHAGQQFDPEVVEVLIRVLEKSHDPFGRHEKPLVIVCDADAEFRKLLQMRLLNEGLDARGTPTADAALEAILAGAPDLVLAHVDGEGSEAFQLLRELRKDAALQHVPFALLAEADDRILKIRALRQGVDDFLVKSGDLDARDENILAREAARRGRGFRRRKRGVTGQLENLALPDIVQTLAIGMKTACVEMESEGRSGRIWFRDGAIVHAKSGDLSGEAAFYEMCRWRAGEFAIEHGVKSRRATIAGDPMFLVMEGMRLLDESTAGETDLGVKSSPVRFSADRKANG